jgi:beta-glucosidase/6-phospho-beta-glucosidase/beta-galactosidase
MSLVNSTLSRLRKEAELEHNLSCSKFFFKPRSFKSVIQAKYILKKDGPEFIEKAYEVLLNRKVDSVGLSYYLQALKARELNKLEIILAIINSPEGKQIKPTVKGLSWRKILNRIYLFKNVKEKY